MSSLEEKRAEQLLEKMPYDRAVLIPVNPDGTLAGVACKNLDFEQAMVAAWAFAVGVAQNSVVGDDSTIVADAMASEVSRLRPRLYIAQGAISGHTS
jgi:hypothetical protein